MNKKEFKSKGIMIQGTASSVGKSLLCTALCRIFTQDGLNVSPFKSQNMSLNSYITYEGHEMGRAQVMQAEACNKLPSAKMNPILLKPTSDRKSQVIINGKVHSNMDAVEYFAFKPQLKDAIAEIYREMAGANDLVVIEGAGSPAEINLKHEDFVNMGMAKIADAPVILVGDIDRGGVFASLAGTLLLLDEEEKKRVKGVIINKFRGSVEILEPGLRMLEEIIKVPVLGVVPYFNLNIEDEDSVSDWLKGGADAGKEIDVAVIRLPYMSNHTDFNALRLHQDVSLRFVELHEALGTPDIVILPGTKCTTPDLEALYRTGMDQQILDCHAKGSTVFGICGGFQMLGCEILDPLHVESEKERVAGLGLLNAVTEFRTDKFTTLSEGYDHLFQCRIKGYEIHMGETWLAEGTKAFCAIDMRRGEAEKASDGAVDQEGRVFGTYLHGIFDSAQFARSLLNLVRRKKGLAPLENKAKDYWSFKEEQYDQLAEIVRSSIDMEQIYRIMEAGWDV